MQVIATSNSVPASVRGGVIAIGNFDGVHRGHQVLLEEARKTAADAGVPWGVVTFDPHPRSVFRPDEPVFRLTPEPLKHRLLAALGCDFVTSMTFNKALASVEAEEFVQRYLVEQLAISHIVTGYDFHFGRGRKGNPDVMKALGAQHGFGVTVVDQVTDDDGMAPYSSSSIRASLRHGRLSEAADDLGYWWMVEGTVVEGDRRGRTIGFPTANIKLDAGCEPSDGIYAVRVRDLSVDPKTCLPGAAYIGHRPTFETEQSFLEIFLLDFDGDIYGHRLLVEIVNYVRPDKKFGTVDELIAQMSKDCDEIRAFLAQFDENNPTARYALGELQANGTLAACWPVN